MNLPSSGWTWNSRNALKKIAEPFSEPEREAMFSGTANRVYRLA